MKCARPGCGHIRNRHRSGGIGSCKARPRGHCSEFVAPAPPPPPPPPPEPTGFKRSFIDSSWWNTKATAALVHPNSKDLLSRQKNLEGTGKIGIGTGSWSMLYSEADSSMPLVKFTSTKTSQSVILNVDVEQVKKIGLMAGNDKAAVFRCWHCDKEISTFETNIPLDANGNPDTTKVWTCTNFGVYRLSGDGVDSKSNPPGDGPGGHRGIPPSAMMITLKELDDGVINHRLKMALGPPGQPADGKPIWPMAGFENRSGVIPEGAVIRLKRLSFDAANLSGVQRVVALAVVEYGMIVGETGGHPTVKAEKSLTYPSGLNNALDAFDLANDYEVLVYGWGKP